MEKRCRRTLKTKCYKSFGKNSYLFYNTIDHKFIYIKIRGFIHTNDLIITINFCRLCENDNCKIKFIKYS